MRSSRLIRSALCLTLLSAAAVAGPVVVLPPPGGTDVQVFTESLQVMGTAAAPPTVFKALVTPQGDKIIFLSSSPSGAVSYVSATSNQLAGDVKTLSLDGRGAKVGALSPDGSKLVVAADATDGRVFIVNVSTMQVVGSTIQLSAGSGVPKDIAFSVDSKSAFILTNAGRLIALDLATQGQVSIGEAVPNASAVSVSPWGRLFVTAAGQIREYTSVAPFTLKGALPLDGDRIPGKLHFSLDGRYAVARNLASANSSGPSILLFDVQPTGSGQLNPAFSIRTADASVPTALFDPTPLKVDEIASVGPKDWIFLVKSAGKIYKTSITMAGALSPPMPQFSANNPLSGVTGIASSGQLLPMPTSFFVTTSEFLTRVTLANSAVGATVPLTSGGIQAPASSSTAAVASIQPYGAGLTLPLSDSPDPVTYAVRVLDTAGLPVYKAQVNFTGLSGVQVDSATVFTNADGVAVVNVTPPSMVGEFSVEAAVSALTVSLKSKVEVPAGGGNGGGGGTGTTRFIRVSGDGQLIRLGLTTTDSIAPLVARLVDAAGKPIANKDVLWTVAANTGAALLDTSDYTQKPAKTDANGEVSVRWSASGLPGIGFSHLPYTFTLTSDVATTEFKAVGYLNRSNAQLQPTIIMLKPTIDAPVITAKLGKPVVGAIQISATSLSQFDQLIPNVGVEVYTGASPEAQAELAVSCGEQVPLTNEQGQATCDLVANGKIGPSPIPMTIRVGGPTGFLFSQFSVQATPGDPAPRIISGDGQTGRLGALLSLPLVIKVDDGFDNVVAGADVQWKVVTDKSLTLENTITKVPDSGLVSTRVRVGTLPGTYKVQAITGGKTVTFTVVAKASLTGFSVVSGNNQTALTGVAFGQPLVVQVKDEQSLPVANVAVAFTVTSGAATLSGSSAGTNAEGKAQINVTAGATAGPILVTASVPGLEPVTFNLQARLPGPAVTDKSFVSIGTGDPGLTPGGLIYITGSGIVPNVSGQVNALMLTGHLPYTVAGFSVEFKWQGGSGYAPIYAVSNVDGQEAAMVQVPYELTGASATAVLRNSTGGSTTVENIPARAYMPAMIREYVGERNQAIVIRSDGSVVSPANPARPGERVRLYATGLGQTTPTRANTNRVGVAGQRVASEVVVGINNEGVNVVDAYMAPNLIGIYEVVFDIPATAPANANTRLGFLIRPQGGGEPVYDTDGSVIAIGQP